MENYQNKENYDYIIRSRLDIVFQKNIMNYLNILDSNENIQYFGYCDCFGIGRPGIMEHYCKMIDNNYGAYVNYNDGDDPIRFRYCPENQLSECLSEYCSINKLEGNNCIKNTDSDFCIIYRG